MQVLMHLMRLVLSDITLRIFTVASLSLNAPYGAQCFLTVSSSTTSMQVFRCLNAPYGAWCFLTTRQDGTGLR